MEIKKPIIIVGSGRSGSTVFFNMMAEHPHVAWLSSLCREYPGKLHWNRRWMKAIDYPLLGRLKKKFYPAEAWPFWEHVCKGFSTPFRDLRADDVTNAKKKKIRSAFAQFLNEKRHRLLIKLTGWPRVGFMHEVFPDAKFVHIIRDGRAVANSLLEMPWWWQWQQAEHWVGRLPKHYQEEWAQHDQSFVALAGIEWKIFMDATEKAKELVDKNQFLEFKYEDLCAEPDVTFRRVLTFCELEWTPSFERAICRYTLKSANDKWQKDLTPAQQEVLHAVVGDYLRKYGYL